MSLGLEEKVVELEEDIIELEGEVKQSKLWNDKYFPTKYAAARGRIEDRPLAPALPMVFTNEETKVISFWAVDEWFPLTGGIGSDGNRNTAGGTDTLSSLTTGIENTGFGYAVMDKSWKAKYNVGVGYRTLWNQLTGESNTAVGHDAMYINVEGEANVAVGREALYSCRRSDYNVAVGAYSLYATTGGQNTGCGYRN